MQITRNLLTHREEKLHKEFTPPRNPVGLSAVTEIRAFSGKTSMKARAEVDQFLGAQKADILGTCKRVIGKQKLAEHKQ